MNNSDIHEFESEETYKDLFDNAHDLIHIARLDGSLVYVNRSWMELLEYPLTEIENQSIYFFIDPQDRERFINYRENIINEPDKKKEIIVSTKTKLGKEVILEGFISVKLKEGKPIYTRGIFREITDKVRQEKQLQLYNEELKERENNLQQLLLHAPDAIIVIGADSNILFWNPKAENIFGWTADEVLGKSLTDKIIPENYREAHTNGMKRYLTTGQAHVLNKTVDITALNKKGEEFYISLTISTTRQKGNIAFIAFIRDITQQKINELELDKKRKELEDSNKELEQFAYAASHDMQEPLRKIRTFVSFLLDDNKNNLGTAEKDYLSKIDSSAERMKNIIDALLNYSHNTKDKEFTEVDLNKVIQNTLLDLELMIQQKKAIVTYDSFPFIEAIQVQIDQLFYNLVHNSLKFSKQGIVPVIHIGSWCVEADKQNVQNFIEIFVRDNGIGFNPEYSEKIFGLFQRLNDRYSYEGTGIGLTLCKKIVENHKGTIRVETILGEGSAFYIQLPVKQIV